MNFMLRKVDFCFCKMATVIIKNNSLLNSKNDLSLGNLGDQRENSEMSSKNGYISYSQAQDKYFQIQECRRHKLFIDLNPDCILLQEKAKMEESYILFFKKLNCEQENQRKYSTQCKSLAGHDTQFSHSFYRFHLSGFESKTRFK